MEKAETQVTAEARTALSVTIYNDGEALVRDTRRLSLSEGENRIAMRDVAATIRAETSSVRPVFGPGFSLLEQNYEFDLLTPESLLKKYVGKDVTVIQTNPATGEEQSETAKVLATNYGVVLRFADRIETSVAGRIAFGGVPADLRERPTLTILLQVEEAGMQELELMYLAKNIGWKADYIINLNRAGTHMHLNGWVTLTNESGANYENVQLQLVAGSLNRVEDDMMYERLRDVAASRVRGGGMTNEKIADFHLYSLQRTTTILDRQTKQVALLAASEVPVTRRYVLEDLNAYVWFQNARSDMRMGLKPSAYLEFENRGGELGIPLPLGVMRVYTQDSRGGAHFIGEDKIDHTASGETIKLRLGEAFDLTADRVQTEFNSLSQKSSRSAYRIEVRNGGDELAKVTIREPLRGEWTISNESHPHVKESVGSAVWELEVPARGSAALEYRVVVRW